MTDETHGYVDDTEESTARADGSESNAPRTDDASGRSAPDDDASSRTAPDEGYECTDCGERWFYALARCPDCGGTDHATYELGVGTLLATTTARVTPADVRDENPVGLAEFDAGVTVLAQLSNDDGRPSVGESVALTGSARLRDDVRGARLVGVDDGSPTANRHDGVRRPDGGES